MANTKSVRVKSLIRSASADSPSVSGDVGMTAKRTPLKKKPKERWLLTRKTWRYMTDAGRKLIPDKADDVPKIEAYFQEVCRREPRFLLWRKNSYPGALSLRKKQRKLLKNTASSVDEKLERPTDLPLFTSSENRFDLQKMKHDFLNSPVSGGKESPRTFLKDKETFPATTSTTDDQKDLVNMLEQYLTICQDESKPSSVTKPLDYQELIDKLQRHLTLGLNPPSAIPSARVSKLTGVQFDGDHVQKSLSETLNRYFSQSPRRDRIISDLLTDRKALQKLYFDLRKAKGFRGRRDYTSANLNPSKYDFKKPPPLIEIQGESNEIIHADTAAQTATITPQELIRCAEEHRKLLAELEDNKQSAGGRRRSSVDHDDVSQSVSDTIKRYLRMARKKSVDSEKADRFKRVNYDRNLRNIKAKGEITKPGDDDGLNKGCQTNDDWMVQYRCDDFNAEVYSGASSARSSVDGADVAAKLSPTSPKSFLAQLLHHKDKDKASVVVAQQTGGPLKSKSSSSVVQQGGRLIAKKMFRSRSKSQTRSSGQVMSAWTPQGSCVWTSVTGKQVILGDTTLLQLSDVERKMLQKVAVAKLQALNLGVNVKVPHDSIGAATSKPKRRPYLLKRKALTTGIFDAARKDGGDSSKDKDSAVSGTGLVFGVALGQCVENERSAKRTMSDTRSPEEPSGINRVSSRSSFTSLIEQSPVCDEKGSCESLMLTRDRIAPGLLDSLGDLPIDDEPAVPNIVNSCIRYLECHGMQTLGIFRVSTSKKRLRQLREDFDCGKDTFAENEQTPHDVATLLKEYLRDLPDPLLCRDLYQAFVQTQRIRNRKLQHEALQHLIQLLPSANRDTLWTLLNFLSTVARNAPDQCDTSTGAIVQGNRMDANNLATVFAPNVLHCIKPGSAKEDKPDDRLDIINVLRALIDHNTSLFTVSAELIDEVYVHMMDLYPELLDQLLNKRADVNVNAEESLDLDSESQSNSAPWTPTALTFDASIPDEPSSNNGNVATEPRKTYSREEFLHESAATGGPNIGMRIRNKDRTRDKSTKKRRGEESSSRRRQLQHDESSATSLISRLRGNSARADEDTTTSATKARSASLDNTAPHTIVNLSDQSRIYSRGVISASLTIPLNQQQTLSIEDIPYIEDAIEPSKQHITIGLMNIAPRRPLIHQQTERQRSMSGESDSSASLTSYAHAQPPMAVKQQQSGSDSAVGSSATHSSAPQSGSSAQDGGAYSSPPSWASTPPTSPDSHARAVNYIPEDYRDEAIMGRRRASKVTIDVAPGKKKDEYTAAITSIGNAVLRSRTADFERISTKAADVDRATSGGGAASKKYTKRRYTDSRHQTRHIPDADTLDNTQVQVYKRKELISSVLSTK